MSHRMVKRKAFWTKLRKLGFRSYADYLASDRWAETRKAYRASDLPQYCLGCESRRFALHHRSYSRIGKERLTDLIPLCRDCHGRVHDYERETGVIIQQTDVMLRRIFGWTADETQRRFAAFMEPKGNGQRVWVGGTNWKRLQASRA